METGEENSSNTNLKRQRVPLSDSEDNLLSPPEVNDGQKRRRLEAEGQENRSPQPSTSARLDELNIKPDTPVVPSVRSRVLQLSQRREGAAPLAQRCLSDPGADSPSAIRQDKVFREHLLDKGEFSQRMERFKEPVFQASPVPTPSPAHPCPRSLSNFVSGIQQKLQGTTTPSSKQASRIRQEREQELNQLPFQPISENAWLKRSSSDPSLSQVDGDGEIKDGSFTETAASDAYKSSLATTASVGVESSNQGQLQMEWEEENTGQAEEVRENRENNPSVGNEEQQPSFHQPEAQSVLQLSFSEDASFSKAPGVVDLNESELPVGDERTLMEWAHSDESTVKETGRVSRVTDQAGPVEDDEGRADSSYDEDVIEPSTDEELRLWRYPEDEACKGGTEQCSHEDDGSTKIQITNLKDDLDWESETAPDVAQPEIEAEPSETYRKDSVRGVIGVQASDPLHEIDVDQGTVEGQLAGLTDESERAEGRESSKKVTFILEPELINGSSFSETSTTVESTGETSVSDVEVNSHDETNMAEMIDEMFEEVLEYAGRMEEDRGDEDADDHDSGIGTCSGENDKMDTGSEKEKSKEEGRVRDEEYNESQTLDSNGDELLTFPPSGILSPLSKSVEAVVTPLRQAASQKSNPPSLLLTPEETSTPPAESAPLYSIDAYRTQRQNKLPTIQSVTPGLQRRAPEKSRPQPSINTKEKIAALNEEAGKLQTVINQTLQALSCCTDEEHGRGSLEEAEAEKLLLVSCEKRSALLAEVARLREERSSDSGEQDRDYVSQQPCRGTISIANIQLPLKVEFVCSSHNRTGRPSHYFFILIRYGPCNIIATPLATAAEAQHGDAISFPTSVTLKDIRSTFEIDVEVYSLSHTSGSNCNMDRTATATATSRSRVTPRKLLNTITRSSNSLTSAAPLTLNTRRSSNFCLVGSHKITLASLGHTKFPLDKMKLEGKIRRLLGDEFQEKVPFLSPLEGNIYLHLDGESHSYVQHQGFLTMFELISGYGVWHRRYFTLDGCTMHYWNHPNDKETKEAEGKISLSSSPSQSVRPVKRDSCARPFTFELVSSVPQQQDNSQEAMAKCWFSADTKQERSDWIEKLSQALLDFHTWNRTPASQPGSQQSSTGNLRESIL
ncbi:anillin, actin binding protein 2 [Aulostomus maculatus]